MSSGRENPPDVVAGSVVGSGAGAGAKEEELDEFCEGSAEDEESRHRGEESRELVELFRAFGRSLAIHGCRRHLAAGSLFLRY